MNRRDFLRGLLVVPFMGLFKSVDKQHQSEFVDWLKGIDKADASFSHLPSNDLGGYIAPDEITQKLMESVKSNVVLESRAPIKIPISQELLDDCIVQWNPLSFDDSWSYSEEEGIDAVMKRYGP